MKQAPYPSLRAYWKAKKQEFIDSCTNCGLCMDVCPIKKYTPFAADDSVTTSEKFIAFLEKGEYVTEWANFGNYCLKCGYCAEACPLGPKLHHTVRDFAYSDMEDMGHGIKKVWAEVPENPESIWKFFATISPKPQDRYKNWVMKIPDNPEQIDFVYYASCASPAFADRLFNLFDMLNLMGKKFVAISPFDNDLCCGSMHMMTGLMDLAEKRSKGLVDALSKYKPKLVVTGCLHTHWWLRDYVSDFYPFDFKVQNEIQFIADNVHLLPFKKNDSKVNVAYHDSCGIGKWTREWDAPRKVLKSLPSVNYIELPRNRNKAACCGLAAPKELQDAMICDRLEEVQKAGASIFASVCAGCNMGFLRHSSKYGITPMNILGFLASQLGINNKSAIAEYTKMGDPNLIYPVVKPFIDRTAYVQYTEEQTKKLLKRYLFPPRTMGLHDE